MEKSQNTKNAIRVCDTLAAMIEHSKFRRKPQCEQAACEVDFEVGKVFATLRRRHASVLERAEYKRARRVFERWGSEEACILSNIADHNIKRVTLGAMLVVFVSKSRKDAAQSVGVSEYQLKNYIVMLRTMYELAAVAHVQHPKVGQATQRR